MKNEGKEKKEGNGEETIQEEKKVQEADWEEKARRTTGHYFMGC